MRCVTCGSPNPGAVDPCPSCGAGRGVAQSRDFDAAFAEPPEAAPVNTGPLRPGQDFGPRYTILKLLGAGGMGYVYEALDRELGAAVALKVLRRAAGDARQVRDAEVRFKKELLLARQITHPHVIRIHDIGEVDGIKFISMALVQGRDLATLLKTGPLPVVKAVRYARQLAMGLVAAHAAGVVHRDLKPANVMIGDDDRAVLMDFGIARSMAPNAPQRTVAGAVMGTAAYMAPEQARGEDVDQRADIYAFGLILYEMLTGPRFMPKGAVADLFTRMTAAPASPRSVNFRVPEALARIVIRCIQPAQADRYQSALELSSALGALSRSGKGPVPGEPRAPLRWKPFAAAAALLLALGGVAYWWAVQPSLVALASPRALSPAEAAADAAAIDRASRIRRPSAHTPPFLADALAQRRQALAENPQSARLRADLAMHAMYAGQFKEAARQARQAVAAAPQEFTGYVPIAIDAALERPATAYAPYEQMAMVSPQGASLAASGLADLALYQRQPDQAVDILLPAIDADRRLQLRAGMASKYLALADARAAQGRLQEAIAAVEQALDASRHQNVLLPAARLMLAANRHAEAAALARELHADPTGYAPAYARMVDSEIALRSGEAGRAIDGLQSLITTHDLWLAHYLLGSAYVEAGRYADAIAELEAAEMRRGEAATVFFDQVPTLRYVRMLERELERARTGSTQR